MFEEFFSSPISSRFFETPETSSKEKFGDGKSPSVKSVEKNVHKESSSSLLRPK